MMIIAPDHTLVARPILPADTGDQASGAFEWLLKRIQVIACGLHGHDSVLQYERNRMFLRCTTCGHETPGWEVEPKTLEMRRSQSNASRPEIGIIRRIA